MIRLALALLGAWLWAGLVLAQSVGPPNTIACNKTATFSGVSAATKLVSAVTGESIFICGWNITNTAATGTFNLTYGTKTTNECDTVNGTLIPTLNVTSSATSADHVDSAQVQIAANLDLCVTPSANTISGVVYYSQF